MRRLFGILTAMLVGLSVASHGVAAEDEKSGGDVTPPDKLVKQTTEKVLSTLQQRQDEIEQDRAVVFDIVRDVVLPHIDFNLISRFVLGQHWRQASEAQRERFVEEFKTLLIRTYGTSLAEYSGQEVAYPPMQGDTESGRVVVKTEIEQADGPTIPITYRLHKTEAGWKVFDVIVEGASYVQTYRSEYGSLVARKGLDGLIEQLAEKNRKKAEQMEADKPEAGES